MKLEYVESLALAHPFIKGFEQVSYCIGEEEIHHVAEGDISEAVAKRKKEEIEGKEDSKVVYSTTFYIGLAIEPKQRASPFVYGLTSTHSQHRTYFQHDFGRSSKPAPLVLAS